MRHIPPTRPRHIPPTGPSEGHDERVAATAQWLRDNIWPTRTIHRRNHSYSLKHLAEHFVGYITDYEFVAAGIAAGYPYRRIPGTESACFGMSKRSLDAARKRVR